MALGVGGILAPAIASADDSPSRPSQTSHSVDRGKPARVPALRGTPQRKPAAAATRSVRGNAVASAADPLRTRPARRADPTAPVALPTAWASAAVPRREFSGPARVAAPAAAAVVAANAVATPDPVAAQPGAGAEVSIGSILDPLISAAAEFFVRQYFPDSRWSPHH